MIIIIIIIIIFEQFELHSHDGSAVVGLLPYINIFEFCIDFTIVFIYIYD